MIVFIPDYFKLNLFPSFQTLFHQYLLRKRESAFTEFYKFGFILRNTRPLSAKCVSRTNHNRKSDFAGSGERILQTFHGVRNRSFYFNFIQFFYKQITVFGNHNGFYRCSQYLYAIPGKYTALIQFSAAIESCLSAKGKQDAVRLFFLNYFFDKIRCNG